MTTEATRTKMPAAVTPNEAAWLTELSTKAINATIDRGELARETKRGRRRRQARTLAPADVLYLAVWNEVSSWLSSNAKPALYDQLVRLSWENVRSAPQSDLVVRLADGPVRIEIKKTVERLWKRWMALEKAKELVVSDPEIRGGEPVIRGTRVPAYAVADLVRQGAGLREILEDFPSLNAPRVRAALAYAQTRPRRGRPKKAPWKE